MKPTTLQILLTLLLISIPLYISAETLEVSPDAHISLRLTADFVLYTHIVGGALGLLTGVVASFSKKGGLLHRRAGRLFLYSMFACYSIGAIVGPFLNSGQRPNFVAAILALYLLLSGVHAAKLKPYTNTKYTLLGLVVSLSITFMGLLFMYMGSHSETGTVDGSPPDAFVVFIVAGALASIGEVRLLIAKTLSETARISRHLWRMCFSFFFASGSLFFGQPQVFPDWFNDSPLPSLFSIFPLMVLAYFFVKIGAKGWKARISKLSL